MFDWQGVEKISCIRIMFPEGQSGVAEWRQECAAAPERHQVPPPGERSAPWRGRPARCSKMDRSWRTHRPVRAGLAGVRFPRASRRSTNADWTRNQSSTTPPRTWRRAASKRNQTEEVVVGGALAAWRLQCRSPDTAALQRGEAGRGHEHGTSFVPDHVFPRLHAAPRSTRRGAL